MKPEKQLGYNYIMLGTKILEEKKSKFNGELRVVKTLGMGTYIQADGLTQSGGIVETIWKQTLRRINNLQFTINNCLILGLGGGTVAKLLRKKYPNVKIMGVDIDPVIVELGKKYLGLNEVDLKIQIGDALSFLTNRQSQPTNRFDLIIVDLYNGDEFPEKFETEDFLKLIRSHLRNNGISIFNRLYYGEKRPQAVKFGNKLQKFFSNVEWFYPEANLMFLCSK
jgi:spermidine synthase